jgi:hypothetical protein
MKTICNLFLPFLFITTLFTFQGCDSEPTDIYHVQKRYWDASDYKNALSLIKYHTSNTEKLPCYSVPTNTPAFLKLIDVNNFKVIMEDKELGIKHRQEFSIVMFDNYQDMLEVYQLLDNQDKFIYPKELALIMNFGLEFQISYFKLGNEKIKKESDNPNAPEIKNLLQTNEQTLIDNFTIDLSFVKSEKAFSTEALAIYSEGIDKYFKQLITEFPDGDYTEMLSKTNLMQEKAETTIVKKTLTNLVALIDANAKSKINKLE